MIQENIEQPHADWHAQWWEKGYLFSPTRLFLRGTISLNTKKEKIKNI